MSEVEGIHIQIEQVGDTFKFTAHASPDTDPDLVQEVLDAYRDMYRETYDRMLSERLGLDKIAESIFDRARDLGRIKVEHPDLESVTREEPAEPEERKTFDSDEAAAADAAARRMEACVEAYERRGMSLAVKYFRDAVNSLRVAAFNIDDWHTAARRTGEYLDRAFQEKELAVGEMRRLESREAELSSLNKSLDEENGQLRGEVKRLNKQLNTLVSKFDDACVERDRAIRRTNDIAAERDEALKKLSLDQETFNAAREDRDKWQGAAMEAAEERDRLSREASMYAEAYADQLDATQAERSKVHRLRQAAAPLLIGTPINTIVDAYRRGRPPADPELKGYADAVRGSMDNLRAVFDDTREGT